MTMPLAPHRPLRASPLTFATAALLIGALVVVAWPLVGSAHLVTALGGIAAVVALAAVGALVGLVAVDVWRDLPRALGRRTGGHLAAYHAARQRR